MSSDEDDDPVKAMLRCSHMNGRSISDKDDKEVLVFTSEQVNRVENEQKNILKETSEESKQKKLIIYLKTIIQCIICK